MTCFQHLSPDGKGPTAHAPALSDWQIMQGGMQAVVVGNRDPPPKVPPINQWEITAEVPPPVALLVATFHEIRSKG